MDESEKAFWWLCGRLAKLGLVMLIIHDLWKHVVMPSFGAVRLDWWHAFLLALLILILTSRIQELGMGGKDG